MAVTTVTVNQWNIKANATEGANLPVICVNRYEWVRRELTADGKCGRVWGPRIGETEHYHCQTFYDKDVHMIYDPVFKTPCGASCWMEFEE